MPASILPGMSQPPLKTLFKCRDEKIPVHNKWRTLHRFRITHLLSSIFGQPGAQSRCLEDHLQAPQEEEALNGAQKEMTRADLSVLGAWPELGKDESRRVADPVAALVRAVWFRGKGVCARTVPLPGCAGDFPGSRLKLSPPVLRRLAGEHLLPIRSSVSP